MDVHATTAPTFLSGVLRAEIADYAPHVRDLLQKPLSRMGNDLDYSVDDILDECREGRMQLWVVDDRDSLIGALVTQIHRYPQRQVATVLLYGAEDHTIDAWLDHFETIKAWAKANDCGAVRITGRRGWAKVLNPDVIRTEVEVTP